MKAGTCNERRFVADVEAFEVVMHDVTTTVRSMEEWLARLGTVLESECLTWTGLHEKSVFAEKAEAINAAVRKGIVGWIKQWKSYETVHNFADSLDDKVLLLVFGKFNAGKSSFCNLLADRFAAHGKEIRYFYLESGQIIETPHRLKEGVTETTSRLQGVRLAGKLILVDTPGLHSATPENAALTQRFSDSADGVLWLTSSTSPGQVQELDELGRELHRSKPLLPIVTRSDVYEEDEVDGEICKVLRSKTPENRAEQEADVKIRAAEKLSRMGVVAELLKTPVSISTYLAYEQGQTPAAMNEAGFERLFDALISITEPTLAYKRRKQAEVLLHHLEENVLGTLKSEIVPLLRDLRFFSDVAADTLECTQKQVANALWRAVVPEIPRWLDEYCVGRDLKEIGTSLEASTKAALMNEIKLRLGEYKLDIRALDVRIEILTDIHLEDVVVETGQRDGEIHKELMVKYQYLHEVLTKAIRNLVVRLADDAVDQCRCALKRLSEIAQRLEASLCVHEEELLVMKRNLRSTFA